MAQYRLLGPHVTSEGILLEAGTVVGDDTPWPWRYPFNNEPMPPSNQMEGCDDEGKKNIEELQRKLYGEEMMERSKVPDNVREARDKQAKEQEKLDEDSKPVSAEQKWERKALEEREKDEKEGMPKPRTPPIKPGEGPSVHTAPQAAHKVGQQVTPGGVATPKPPKDEDIRPSNPNEDQYPKG